MVMVAQLPLPLRLLLLRFLLFLGRLVLRLRCYHGLLLRRLQLLRYAAGRAWLRCRRARIATAV